MRGPVADTRIQLGRQHVQNTQRSSIRNTHLSPQTRSRRHTNTRTRNIGFRQPPASRSPGSRAGHTHKTQQPTFLSFGPQTTPLTTPIGPTTTVHSPTVAKGSFIGHIVTRPVFRVDPPVKCRTHTTFCTATQAVLVWRP